MQPNHYQPQRGMRMQNSKCRLYRWWLWLFMIILIVAAVVIMLVFNNDERRAYNASRNVFLDNISVNGLDLGGMMYNEGWNAVMQQAENAQNTWQLEIACNGFTYATVNYAAIGITTDYVQLEQLLIDAWQLGRGTFEQYQKDAAALAVAPFEGTLSQSSADAGQIDYVLDIIAENVYRAPQDAVLLTFSPENAADPFVISASAQGSMIDKESAKAEILRRAYAGEGGRYDIPLMVVEPSVSETDLRNGVTLLAEGKNAIDKSSTEERNENIRLSLSKFNGYVLNDGATFSFNDIVGARTEKNGYKPALGYVSGELVQVIGGGVCQASTTLYSAALRAGMTIVERTPHSMPVSYIELGQDAAVNYVRGHMIDLKFKNETGSPIYITAAIETSESGRMISVVRFFGKSHEDGVHYKVDSVEVERLPIPEKPVVRKDRDGEYVKYTDQTYTYSKGSEGHVVSTYLRKYSGAMLLEETLVSTDTYNAQPVIQYVGITIRK